MVIPNDWPQSSYATHFHLLTDLMLCFRPRRILETGSGLYSTPFFLAFDIDQLVSIENSREWYGLRLDDRHELTQVDGPVADSLPDVSGFDLVFVDDDPVDDRCRTLRKVLDEAQGLVVVHDTSDSRLHAFIADRPNHTDTRHPFTTVVHPTESKEFAEWLATR